MSDVHIREAEVLRVKPGEFLLIKLAEGADSNVDLIEEFVGDLVASGLERGRFAVVNGDGIEFTVVEKAP